MPDQSPYRPAEHWRRVQSLFERMQDSADPMGVAAAEPDPEIAAGARRLWQQLRRADADGFLARPIELISNPAVEPPPQFAPGQVLAGRFEIQRLLGAGGMGEVYLAYDNGLHEPAAIKTIRANLAADPAIRRRFLAEVQNARRVTHPHVCRINDLFDECGLPFLSMEYLEGERLSTWLEQPGRSRRTARAIALQLGEALAAAHRVGILHCDFKPANIILTGSADAPRAVITDFGLARALRSGGASPEIAAHSLRAGTFDYMAPEFLAGGPPTVRTDIYAYGKVLGQLLPNHRMAAKCQAARPDDRPASLAPVIRSLRGDLPRRVLLGGGIAVAAAAATYELTPRPGLPLAARTRIAINGFRAGEPTVATVFRELLITALRQSTLLTVVADDHLRSLLKSHKLPTTLPADRTALASAAAAGAEIALVVEGVLASAARGLKVSLDVFVPAAPKPSLSFSEQVGDARKLVQLADQTALRLRREFGESPAALRVGAGYTPLEQVTSASPEAVECYFNGMREYSAARTEPAIAFYDQAVSLDPQFALAHLSRATALIAHFRLDDSFQSFQRAFALRSRITERERLWIEAQYFNATRDYESGIKSCLRLTTLFPEEARFHRQVGFLWARLGRPKDSLPHNQRAVELDSTEVANLSEWIVNNTDAGLYDEALALYRRFRSEGQTNTLLNWGAGLAYIGKDDFDTAYATFVEMGSQPERDRWARLLQCGPLILSGRFQEAASALRGDLAWDIANNQQAHLHDRRVWLGMLEWMIGNHALAQDQVDQLAKLDPYPPSFEPLRHAGLLAVLLGKPGLATQVLAKLRKIEERWPSSNTQGARAVLEGAIRATSDPAGAGLLFETARGLRADPVTLYHAAQAQLEAGSLDAALSTLTQLEAQRGQTHRLYFAPLSTLARIQRARCLARMSRFSDSLRLYEWVLGHWKQAGNFGIVHEVRTEYRKLNAQS